MTKSASILLLTLSLGLASCSSTGGPSGGLLGLVTGGVLGHLIDTNSTKNNTNGTGTGTSGTVSGAASSVSGTANSAVANATGTNQDDFFGENKGAITGAVAGAVSGLVTDQVRKGEIQKKYDEGYAKAKSDAIKEFYWLKRDAQKAKGNGDDPPVQYRYYEVEVPAHTTSDGVFIDKHKRVIEVVE